MILDQRGPPLALRSLQFWIRVPLQVERRSQWSYWGQWSHQTPVSDLDGLSGLNGLMGNGHDE